MKYLIDTNILAYSIVFGVKEIPQGAEDLVSIFDNLDKEDRIIPITVLTEFNLLYQNNLIKSRNLLPQSKTIIRKRGNFLINNIDSIAEVISPNKQELNKTIKIYSKSLNKNGKDSGLSLNDILCYSICKSNNYKILTRDKKLLKLFE